MGPPPHVYVSLLLFLLINYHGPRYFVSSCRAKLQGGTELEEQLDNGPRVQWGPMVEHS
jgi:hypothetical protein